MLRSSLNEAEANLEGRAEGPAAGLTFKALRGQMENTVNGSGHIHHLFVLCKAAAIEDDNIEMPMDALHAMMCPFGEGNRGLFVDERNNRKPRPQLADDALRALEIDQVHAHIGAQQ